MIEKLLGEFMHAVASKVVQIQHSAACVFPKIARASACFRAVILLVHLFLPWCCAPTKCFWLFCP